MNDAFAHGLAYGLTGAALLSYAMSALEARTILIQGDPLPKGPLRMLSYYNITDIVKTAQKSAPLPANYNDLDQQNKRRIEREAQAKGTTPEALYAAIRAQAERDAADGFDAVAIAKAARR